MKHRSPRVKLESKQVAHHKKGSCFVPGCENDAEHEILGPKNTKICTKHMSMFFKLPANRFERQKKKKKTFNRDGVFFLRRHMDMPLVFKGERVAWHSFVADDQTWFISLYWKNTEGTTRPMYVLSITRAFDKYTAIHQVQEYDPVETNPIEILKYLLHVHGSILEIGQLSQVALGIELTRFIEKIANPKQLSPANKGIYLATLQRALAEKPDVENGGC